MSELTELYDTIKKFKKFGLPINDELEQRINELEEELIKKEVVPLIRKQITPALKEVQRELVLVVDYNPGGSISVHLSRKRNFIESIPDAKEILPDPQVEHSKRTRQQKSKKKKSGSLLRLTFADGRVIEEDEAQATFVKFVKEVGADRVRALNMKNDKKNIVTNTIDKKYAGEHKPLGSGWYLNTHSSTNQKKSKIERIAKAYNIKVKVEIV